MKVLVVGCGSIGRRHILNLCAMRGISSIEVYSHRASCLDFLADRTKPVTLISGLLRSDADCAVICNQTNKHVETAIRLAGQGMHLFIEKPLSNNNSKIKRLLQIIRHRRLKIFVGYNMRFLPALQIVKRLVASGRFGKILFAHIEAGQYLPDWRNGRDYRNVYSANRSQGGGAGLDLSHEIDYMRYIFGEPLDWKIMTSNTGHLGIDADELFEGMYRFPGGFVCHVHLDYLQKDKKRSVRLVAEKGELVCDLVKKVIRFKMHHLKKATCIARKEYFDIEDTYRKEMQVFIAAIRNDSPCPVGPADGAKVLELLEDSRV